jgi:acetyl-CoA synthetase (ADP-forming)
MMWPPKGHDVGGCFEMVYEKHGVEGMAVAANPAEVIEAGLARGQRALSEYESKRVLASYGVPIVEEGLAQDAAAAVTAADRIGYPVVVKACSPALMHKSDQGLVALSLGSPDAVRAASETIRRAVGDAPLDGLLVQRMVRGKREMIVGGIRDQLFGPCLMLGLGGILVEVLADVAFRLAPLDERDALEMIREIRAQRVFDVVRGEPAVDRRALSRVLIAVGQVLLDHPRVSQVDLNPLILEGEHPVAVDALITLVSA